MWRRRFLTGTFVFKRYFVTGLLIWVPLVITVWVLSLVVSTLEAVVPSVLTPSRCSAGTFPDSAWRW